jgi:hypothetical protein
MGDVPSFETRWADGPFRSHLPGAQPVAKSRAIRKLIQLPEEFSACRSIRNGSEKPAKKIGTRLAVWWSHSRKGVKLQPFLR